MSEVLIYGAYGYSGKLITEECLRNNIKPVIAGRNEEALKTLADKHQLKYKVLSTENTAAIDEALSTVNVLINCAGPFKDTAEPLVEACLRTHTHYLDITGEMRVFEFIHLRDEAAKHAGIMLLPGCGFDVVPTDCLAALLKQELPDAKKLMLAFKSGGKPSKGTTKTSLRNVAKQSYIRKGGQLKQVPFGDLTTKLHWKKKEFHAVAIPWGDVVTAYYSTGIPDIEVYMTMHPQNIRLIRWSKYFKWLLKQEWFQNIVLKFLFRKEKGHDEQERKEKKNLVWGQVWNVKGETISKKMECPSGYETTHLATVAILKKVLNGHIKKGYQTPSSAYGPELLEEIEGIKIFI